MSNAQSTGMVDMTVGSPLRHILKFSIPLLIGNIFQQAYNLVDSVVVGNFVGSEALAAVNTAFPVMFILISLFIGMGMGGTIMISQFFGAGDMDSVRKTIRTANTALLAISVPLTVIGLVISKPALRLLNVPDDTFGMAHIYLVIIFIGLIGSMGYNVNFGILQGLGDSRSPLRFLIVACGLNIVLDLALVIPLGVAGVAIATVVAQLFSWIYGILYIRKKYPELNYNPFSLKLDVHLLKKIITLGLPIGLQQMLFSVGVLVLQRLINSQGSSFIAGFSAAMRIDNFIALPLMSFANALSAFVGQNVGAGKYDRVQEGLKATLLISSGACLVITAVVLPLGQFFLKLFNQKPEVIHAGMAYLLRVVPFFLVLTALFMLTSVLRGAGATVAPLLVTFVAMCVVRVPAAYVLEHYFGAENLYFSFGLGWGVGAVLALMLYLSGGWKSKRIVQDLPEPGDGASPPGVLLGD